MTRTDHTGWIGAALATWVRLALRHRTLVALLGLAFAVVAARYAASNLGINTDTADMISSELSWRQDYIAYRDQFAIRDRNVIVVVDADSPEDADAAARAIAEGLQASPELYRGVFVPGGGEFFERHGLLYQPVEELEALRERLLAVRPLLGQLRGQLDGTQLIAVLEQMVAHGVPVAEGLYQAVAEALEAAAEQRPYTVSWRGLFDGEESGAARRFVLLQPQQDFSRARPAAEAMDGISELLARLAPMFSAGTRARVTGTVAMEHEELSSVTRGASLAGLAALLLVALVLYAALRSVAQLLIAITTLVVGLFATAAFAAAAIGSLNLISVAFAVLYVGLGVDFILHIGLRLNELRSQGAQLDAAIVSSVAGVGSSLVICSVTTAAGFYAFIPTPFSGVAELGLIAGTGMFISLFVSVTLLPVLLAVFMPDRETGFARPWIGTSMLGFASGNPRAVLLAAGIAAVSIVLLLPRVSFDRNPVNLRDPGTESVMTLREIVAQGDALPLTMVALAPDAMTAADWAAELEALPEVESVVGVAALVPDDQEARLLLIEQIGLLLGPSVAAVSVAAPDAGRFGAALESLEMRLSGSARDDANRARLASALRRFLDSAARFALGERAAALSDLEESLLRTLPPTLERLATGLGVEPVGRDDLPEEIKARWISADGTELIEIFPAQDVTDTAGAEAFIESVRSIVPAATGLPVVYQEGARTVVRAFQLAFAYALVLICVILWFCLRRAGDALLVVAPVLFAAGMTAALTVGVGIEFNFANVIALPLLLGVGVDNGIHMVHRMRTEPPSEGAVSDTSTSRAVLASGLTTIASFGNLAFVAHQGMASMGQLLTIGMLVTLGATLVLLPALLAIRAQA